MYCQNVFSLVVHCITDNPDILVIILAVFIMILLTFLRSRIVKQRDGIFNTEQINNIIYYVVNFILIAIILVPLCNLLSKLPYIASLGYINSDLLSYAGAIASIAFAVWAFHREQVRQEEYRKLAVKPMIQIELSLLPYALHAEIKNIGSYPAYRVQFEGTKIIPYILPNDSKSIDIRYKEQTIEWERPNVGTVITVLLCSQKEGFCIDPETSFPSDIRLSMLDIGNNFIREAYYPTDFGSNVYIAGPIPKGIQYKRITTESDGAESSNVSWGLVK